MESEWLPRGSRRWKERQNMSSLHFGNYLNEIATVPLDPPRRN